MVKRYLAPKTGNPELDKAMQVLCDYLNDLYSKIGEYNTTKTETGLTGNIRIINTDTGRPKIQVRTEYGWFETDTLKALNNE